tara:strand:- start:43230 stop:43958 length:729 start_codon:yes stop_codon:yes gene_type:complete
LGGILSSGNMRFLFLFLALISTSFVFTQESCDKVFLKGRVIDSLRPQSFYNLMVVNKSAGKGVFGQPNGFFSAYVSEGDQIVLSIKGYPKYQLNVKADSNCQCIVEFFIERPPQVFDEVIIRPLKTLDQIKEDRSSLALRETRMVTGIQAFQSPITALYQAFSKKERNKRWIAEQEYKDNKAKIVRELLSLYVAYDILELDENQFDIFIQFLNINEDFLKTASEMELVLFIKDKYEHFLMLR